MSNSELNNLTNLEKTKREFKDKIGNFKKGINDLENKNKDMENEIGKVKHSKEYKKELEKKTELENDKNE